MRLEVLRGPDALVELGSELDDLLQAVGAPLTARRPWLQAWVDTYPHRVPTVLVIRNANGGLEAAAPLAVTHRLGQRIVTTLGHGSSDAARLPARSAKAGELLADHIANWLEREVRNWSLVLRHLDPEDLIGAELVNRLRRSWMNVGAVSPQLHVSPGAVNLAGYVSARHGQEVRRRWRRMLKDGLEPTVQHLTSYEDIRSCMVAVEEVFRARDAQLNRRCALDDERAGFFFRQVVDAHAVRHEVSMTTLRLSGSLAAYVLCFIDGDTYRMWNCRFHPRYARYSAGMIAMDASIEQGLANGCRVYDFMRGEEPYKESYANYRMVTHDVRAWSGALSASSFRLWLLARKNAEAWESRGRLGASVVNFARTAAESVRGQ